MKRLLATLTLSLFSAPILFASSGADWGYNGEHGPAHWGDIKGDYAQCSKGKEQSPIDLKWKQPKNDRSIKFHYQKSAFEISDNGHTIKAGFDKGNYIEVEGHKYNLLQLHFHAHSEHSISKKFFPMEMHLVHQDEHGKLAVVGVMFTEGQKNQELEHLLSQIPHEKNHPKKVSEKLAIDMLLPMIHTHYHYMGSLTTPPCSEGVNWNVLNTPIQASAEQIAKFQKLYSANYRPVQGLNGRVPANF